MAVFQKRGKERNKGGSVTKPGFSVVERQANKQILNADKSLWTDPQMPKEIRKIILRDSVWKCINVWVQVCIWDDRVIKQVKTPVAYPLPLCKSSYSYSDHHYSVYDEFEVLKQIFIIKLVLFFLIF